MQRSRRNAAISSFFVLGIGISVGIVYWLAPQRRTAMHSVSINIPGSAAAVRGIDMRGITVDGRGDLTEPQELTLHLGDGAAVSLVCRSSSVHVNRGSVSAVYLRRPMKPVRFLEAKEDLLRTISRLGIEPDGAMKDQMAAWTQDVPGNGEVPGLLPYDWKAGRRTPFHGLILDVRLSPDPQGGWYYLLIFSAITADSIPGISPATQPSTSPVEAVREVSVKLLGSTVDLGAGELRKPTEGMGELDILHAQHLLLALPDGATVGITARSSNVITFDGVVRGVFVRRPMTPVPFEEAKNDMLRTLSDLRIDPDKTTRAMMSEWSADDLGRGPRWREYQAGFKGFVHGAMLTMRLCPAGDGNWYYLMIFSCDTAVKSGLSR